MKRHILWDHDGVLVETEPLFYEATRDALAAIGVELPLSGYLADMATGRSAWERARNQGIDEATIQTKREARDRHYQELLCERDIEIPGVEQVLATLGVNHSMAIVTTAKKSDFELIHRHRNIVGYMELVLTRGDYQNSKPAPDPYLSGRLSKTIETLRSPTPRSKVTAVGLLPWRSVTNQIPGPPLPMVRSTVRTRRTGPCRPASTLTSPAIQDQKTQSET